MNAWTRHRFALAWALPLMVGAAMLVSPLAAWATMFGIQVTLALAETVPAWRHSPAAAAPTAVQRFVLRAHVPLQAALLALGLWTVVTQSPGWTGVLLLALAAGGISGSQGITFAHELGHSRSRSDRVLAWLLMASVNYAHFMVEHYRGHHPRAATWGDPASARRGESLWRFLPRTLTGSWRSAWTLEAAQRRALRRGWGGSPLLWATLIQAACLATLVLVWGPKALAFWLLQSAYAVFLLETVNYIEHYGLQRTEHGRRREPFGLQHAWNADHLITNSVIANLQRHSDHHMNAWKPFTALEPLPGPQLPTGYAGCLFLASVPPLWFRVMHRRLDALPGAAPAVAPGTPATSG
jgi:alkane 1-monooxygenase